MKIIRSFEQNDAAVVNWGVRVLLLSSEGEAGLLSRKLAALGGKVDVADELFSALSEVIDDPSGYALFVVDCDCVSAGGLGAVQRAMPMLGELIHRIPIILVSTECRTQTFPADRAAPIVLRAPLSAVSLKVGFEHALRERLIYRAA